MEIVVLYPYKKKLTIEEPLTLGELLALLEISFKDVLVLRNNSGLIQELDSQLEKDDFIQILPVISGG